MGVPGVAVGVFHGDHLRSTGLGVTDVRTNEPVDSATAFQLASLTKVVTASAVVAAARDAGLDLRASVAAWYPKFAVSDPVATESTTMTHLLSHSAGWAEVLWPNADAALDTLEHYAEQMSTFPQVAPPGALFNYSNSSFVLAGHILATINGTSYEASVRHLILTPLGMAHSGFEREEFSGTVVASGHAPSDDGMETVAPWEIPRVDRPASGLYGTVDDMLRFVRFHAGAFAPQHGPLAEADRLRMHAAHAPGGSVGVTAVDSIGLGWMRSNVGGQQIMMSMGSDASQAAGMAFVHAGSFGIVVLTNAESGLFLVNDTLLEAYSLFLDARPNELVPIQLEPDDLAAIEGSYAIPNDLAFEITSNGRDLEISATAGGQQVPDLSGMLTMISSGRGYIDLGGPRLLYDFERAEDGEVGWVRFAGRLAPRLTT